MRIKVDVKIDSLKISQLEEAHKQALEMTADSVLSDIKTSAVVPKESGELERSGFVDTAGISWGYTRIIFDTPYARRLYWHPEYNFRKDKNVNAQGKWMESYLIGDNKKFIKDSYSNFFRMKSKGLIK